MRGTMTNSLAVSKTEILAVIEQFPDEIDLQELVYRLQLQRKLAEAEADFAAGRTISHEEMRARAKTWRK